MFFFIVNSVGVGKCLGSQESRSRKKKKGSKMHTTDPDTMSNGGCISVDIEAYKKEGPFRFLLLLFIRHFISRL